MGWNHHLVAKSLYWKRSMSPFSATSSPKVSYVAPPLSFVRASFPLSVGVFVFGRMSGSPQEFPGLVTRWFQIFFMFHPYLGKIPILTHIFQMGWNHQLGNLSFFWWVHPPGNFWGWLFDSKGQVEHPFWTTFCKEKGKESLPFSKFTILKFNHFRS